MTRLQFLLPFALLSILACDSDNNTEGEQNDQTDAASICCPVDENIDCHAPYIGGTRDLSQPEDMQCTRGPWDAEPDGWVEELNADGCPELRWVGGTGSCFPLELDAGVEDAAPSPDSMPSS